MSNKFLGQYLLEKGIISPTQLLTAIELQKKSNPTLGQLAVSQGYIDNDAANKINLEQQRTDERFGTLAVNMGLMDESQIEALFNTQQKNRKYFGEILVEQEMLDQQTLDAELLLHKQEKDQAKLVINAQITQHEHSKLINNTLETIIKSLTRIPKIPAKISNISGHLPTNNDEYIAISQLAHIPHSMKIGIVVSRQLMKKIGTNFLGFDVSNDEVLYLDAMGELLNIMLGNVLVINGSEQTELEPPVNEQISADLQAPYQQQFLVDMSADGQNFTVFFMYD